MGGSFLPFNRTETPEREDTIVYKIPSYLKPGDTIGITSPAGTITLEEMAPALAVIRSWGYQIKIGAAIGKKDFTRGGTDEERRADLQDLLRVLARVSLSLSQPKTWF